MKARTRTRLRWVTTRVAVFHAIAFLLVLCLINTVRLRTKIVNYFKPGSMAYLSMLPEGRVEVNQQVLKSYEKYFRVLNRYAYATPFTYGVQGFISYHQGDIKRAIKYYEKALGLYPLYLNYHYNLALLNLRRGDAVQAAALLAHALQTGSVDKDCLFIEKSRFEVTLIVGEYTQQSYAAKWKTDYKDAGFLLLVILVYTGNKDRAAQVINQLVKTEEDQRFSCLQKYITGQDSFKACQKEMGWKSSGTDEDLNRDPFNIKQLSLKIW